MSLFSPPSIQQQLDLLGPRAGAATVRDDESVDMYEDMEDDAVPSQPRVFPRRLDISGGPVHMRAVSLPAPTPPRMTPDPSSSPAARFLSGFYSPATLSPAASPQVQLPPVEPEPDAEGLEIAGFVLGRELGRGGFSLIRQATNQNTGAVVAVKVVRQPEPNAEHAEHRRTQLQRETDLWRQLSHEHVLPLFSAHTTFRATYFITQFCPAGTLYDILRKDGKPTMDDAGMMFRQVVRGLRYLHEIARVVHGDMKLENVLVDEFGTCKISDFGMARAFDETDADITGDSALDSSSSDDAEPVQTSHSRRQTLPGLTVHLSLMRSSRHNRPSMPSSSMSQSQLAQARQHVQPGSLPYAAPELLMPVTRRRKAGHSGPGQDVWAVGVMLYVLLTGVFPFADTFEPRVRRKILAGKSAPLLSRMYPPTPRSSLTQHHRYVRDAQRDRQGRRGCFGRLPAVGPTLSMDCTCCRRGGMGSRVGRRRQRRRRHTHTTTPISTLHFHVVFRRSERQPCTPRPQLAFSLACSCDRRGPDPH